VGHLASIGSIIYIPYVLFSDITISVRFSFASRDIKQIHHKVAYIFII
jgi:Zn-dependent membrane protease YugP